MRKLTFLLATSMTLLLLLLALEFPVAQASPIKHWIVLMQENRSFDHLLGWLKNEIPNLDGVNATEPFCNPYDTQDPNSGHICTSNTAEYRDPDPGHSVPDVAEQAFGVIDEDEVEGLPPTMQGFVQNAERLRKGMGENVMRIFDPEAVPVSSELAREFLVFDRWFCSMPGNTMPNRFYLYSCTSAGMANNDVLSLVKGFDLKTIFESLDEKDFTWTSYFELAPTTLFYKWTRKPSNWKNFKHINRFYDDAREGTLPMFSFIDPRYIDIPGAEADDDHPSHDVSQGQLLMKRIYEAVRNSPLWEQSALIITYDEHGGFFDHVPIPTENIPNPDGLQANDPYEFDFERLGVRVPTILISPWVDKGVEHEPTGPSEYSHYDHSSLHATLKKMYGLEDFLTERDEWAGTFEHLFNRTSPRTDCPTELPAPTKSLRHKPLTGDDPLTQLQQELVWLASSLHGSSYKGEDLSTSEAATYIKLQINKFFGRQMYEGDDLATLEKALKEQSNTKPKK